MKIYQAKERLAHKLRRIANRLDNGPFPGELLAVTYTPGASHLVIGYDGQPIPPPPGIWEAQVKLHFGNNLTLAGRLEPVL